MNRIFKSVWSVVRRCYVVVSETQKALKKNTKSKAVAGTLLAVVASSAFAQNIYEYDQYKDYSFGNLSDFVSFSAIGSKSLTMGVVNAPNGSIYVKPKPRVENGGADGIWTPEDFYHTRFSSKSITIAKMNLQSGTFSIHGNLTVLGKIDNNSLVNAINAQNKPLWSGLFDKNGALRLTNAKTFEPGVINGDLTASLLHLAGEQNDKFSESRDYNGRIIIRGNLTVDNMVMDSPWGFDTHSDYVEVQGKTQISNNLYNNGYLKAQQVIVNGTFYNGWGSYLIDNEVAPDQEAPSEHTGAVIHELNAKNIVNRSNLREDL